VTVSRRGADHDRGVLLAVGSLEDVVAHEGSEEKMERKKRTSAFALALSPIGVSATAARRSPLVGDYRRVVAGHRQQEVAVAQPREGRSIGACRGDGGRRRSLSVASSEPASTCRVGTARRSGDDHSRDDETKGSEGQQ